MRPLSTQFQPYGWAPSTAAIAELAGIPPERVLRFDGNTPPRPQPASTAAAIADDLARINSYRHGGFPELDEAVARYAGVEPENVVVGAGADDLIMLVARSFAGPGDVVAVADQPTYPVLRMSAWLAGADVGDDDPVLTFCCRPHNPTGALVPLPEARPLAVDEAYFEFSGGETAVGLIGDGDVVVIRTFSKAFGLASARIGYALARADLAEELRQRQSPAPVSTLSVALALAGLADPPDVSETLAERERLAAELRSAGLDVPDSYGNFVFVPLAEPRPVFDALLRQGLAVRPSEEGVRITVRDPADDDLLVARLAALVG
ncbi:MAG TPA: aminotransferase class I/II-fold pyridoxal phosphate-dependent enzyme [Gaiellaceae bacterium]